MSIMILAQVYRPFISGANTKICAPSSQKVPVHSESQVISKAQSWMVPVVQNGQFVKYFEQPGTTAPTPDSIPVFRVRNHENGEPFYIIGQLSEWNGYVNLCCGTTPAMTSFDIIDPLVEDQPCAPIVCTVQNPAYTYTDSAPTLAAGEAIVPSGSQNGVAFSPAYTGNGFLTVGAALTWLQANWGSYGTWSLTPAGTGIRLASNAPAGQFRLGIKAKGSIATTGTLVGGSGGSGGPFTNVPFIGGTGTGAKFTVALTAGAVSNLTITDRGQGYTPGDSLTALPPNIGGTTGFSVLVATVQTGS